MGLTTNLAGRRFEPDPARSAAEVGLKSWRSLAAKKPL
jgi:hypothetical protein